MQTTILITGAQGELGHALINSIAATRDTHIVALDRDPLDEKIAPKVSAEIQGDICDPALITSLRARFQFDTIFHFAALLSTATEKQPLRAHEVNINGSLRLLELAHASSEQSNKPTRFIFPSTVAAYGLPTSISKSAAGKVAEESYLTPATLYGSQKLFVEQLGRYFENYIYSLEEHTRATTRIDFRALRFPGLISADTVPTGGTSDYGAEMLHHAAQGKPYNCFVEPEAVLPFMAMPDAVRAILLLAQTPREQLTRKVYNVTGFSIGAEQIRQEVLKHFPGATIGYKLHPRRAEIVASWPGDLDDTAAKRDFDWAPEYDASRIFSDYLVPAIQQRYNLRSS